VEDLVDRYPELTSEVVLSTIALQGTRLAPSGAGSNEEEPGRIHHEYRARVMSGQPVGSEALAIMAELSRRWGGDNDRIVYYGTVDATPLFVRVIAHHVALHGPALLDRTALNKDGETVSVRDGVLAAAAWIEGRIASSSLGLLDFQRRNPDGIENQVWTDGKTSLLDPSGAVVDASSPIATPEVQGLAYDALRGAARLLADSQPQEARRWEVTAAGLRERTLSVFWMSRLRYPAMAVTLDAWGRPRVVPTVAATGAELLDCEIFDDLPTDRREYYVQNIARRVVSSEFVTDGGIRTISSRHRHMINYWQYQGANTTWPKQTHDISKGLRRQGFSRLADQLDHRLLNAVNIESDHKELFYVDDRGRVVHDVANVRRLPSPRIIAATNPGDNTQTWTVTAALAIKLRRGRRQAPSLGDHEAFEEQVLAGIRRIQALTKRSACAVALQRCGGAAVNVVLGRQRERALLVRSSLSRQRGRASRTLSA